jgi:hypothetical protein
MDMRHFCHYPILLLSDLANYFSTYKISSGNQLHHVGAAATGRHTFYGLRYFRIRIRLPNELLDIKPRMNKIVLINSRNWCGKITYYCTNQLYSKRQKKETLSLLG